MRRDSGSTLLEVLIASVILVVSAAVFISGSSTHTNTRKRVDVRANISLEMTAAAQYVASLPFEACPPGLSSTLPYRTALDSAKSSTMKLIATNPAVTAVDVWNPSTGQWVDCRTWGAGASIVNGVLQDLNSLAPLVTRVEISDLTSNPAKKIYISKTQNGSDPNGTFKVEQTSPTSCGGWWGGSLATTVRAVRGSTPVSGATLFILPPGPATPQGVSSPFTTSQSGATFTLTAPANPVSPAATYGAKRTNLEIGAFDPVTATYAVPLTVPQSIWDPLAVTPSAGSWTVVDSRPVGFALVPSGGGGAITLSADSPFKIDATVPTAPKLTWDYATSLLGDTKAAKSFNPKVYATWDCWSAQRVGTYSLLMRQELKGAFLLSSPTDTLSSTAACTPAATFTNGCTLTITRFVDIGTSREATGSSSWRIKNIIVTPSNNTTTPYSPYSTAMQYFINGSTTAATAADITATRTSDSFTLKLQKNTSGKLACRNGESDVQVLIELEDLNNGVPYSGAAVATRVVTPTTGFSNTTNTAYLAVYIKC